MSGDTIARSGKPHAVAASDYLLGATSLGKCTTAEDGTIARRWPNLSDGEEALWSVLELINTVDFERLDLESRGAVLGTVFLRLYGEEGPA